MEQIPWVEKYRPSKLSDIKGQNKVINTLKNMVNNGNLPNLIFHGSAGTGKTSTILALIKYLYKDNSTYMTLELNASDDRGINVVRDDIKDFSETKSFFTTGIKIVILDEVDAMTLEAQDTLRYFMDKYSKTTRFCLICNYFHKIIEPIKSRCCVFRFLPLSLQHTKNVILNICSKENIHIDDKSIHTIYHISNGDIRKSINILQSISINKTHIDNNLILSLTGFPSKDIIKQIIDILLDTTTNYKNSYKLLKNIIEINGFTLSSLLNSLSEYMLDYNIHLHLLKDLSLLEYQVNQSTFSTIYLHSLIALFKK